MSLVVPSRAGFSARTLADIAATLPGATGVFRRRRLDYCCGGQVLLEQAAAERGLAGAELEAELETAAIQGLTVERPEGTVALTDLNELAITPRTGVNCQN
jgi:regulator of cell morphogenesis and NO signaling